MTANRIFIFDTTLRDGGQCRGTPLSAGEKLALARGLAELNVDVIEAGFPAAVPEDAEALRAIGKELRGPVLAALARAQTDDIEAAARALETAARPRIHVYVPTGNPEREHPEALRETILKQTRDGVEAARRRCGDVEFSPHNATRLDETFLCEIVQTALDAGARTLNISDTLGCAVPDRFGALIRRLKENVRGLDSAVLSVHCHNDLGLAVANSLAAVQAGARQVECTVNGIGERAGNAAMEEIVMALRVRQDAFGLDCGIDTRHFKSVSREVSRLTGYPVAPNKAIVGDRAVDFSTGEFNNGFQEQDEAGLARKEGIPGES